MESAHFKKYKWYYLCISILLLIISGICLVFAKEISTNVRNFFRETPDVSTLEIIKSVEKRNLTKSHCQAILSDEITNYSDKSGRERQRISGYFSYCEERYDIAYASESLSFCKRVIQGKKEDFAREYIKLDGFDSLRQNCSDKYLTVSFTGGILFNPENDFKSNIHVNFGLPFYYDEGNPESDEFIAHRVEAKQRLLSMIEISPKVEIDIEDIVLHQKQATISLHLLPETSYSISFKEYQSEIQGEKMKADPMTLEVPDFKYLGLKRNDRVALMQDTASTDFDFISFNSDIESTDVKICRVPNESYAKIEVMQSTKYMQEAVNDFFVNGIDDIESFDCNTKTLTLKDEDRKTDLINIHNFDFDDVLGSPARSGLYYVVFDNKEHRNIYQRTQKALFFGVIDSHITMKVSKTGSAFFFVNDFAGKPLAGQTLRVYTNEFKEREHKYDYRNKKDLSVYFSPLEENVFTSGAVLGTTNSQGILQVQLDGKVADFFEKTLHSWNYSSDGVHNSFFVTSASDTNLSYVSSKWNGGITPWNFGYTIGSRWWRDSGDKNADDISLDRWNSIDRYYGHSFTDRRLYLPGEQVNIKSVVRRAGSLTIPMGDSFDMIVKDPSSKEILNKVVTVSQHGSINEALELADDAALGNYYVYFKYGDRTIINTGFSVEIFQNPKFKNDIILDTNGLEDEMVKISDIQKTISHWGYERETYLGEFTIKATVESKYYSGNPVNKAKANYKVYKQRYYDDSYWNDCFYGCYWEAEKEFYTEGNVNLDESGIGQIEIPVEFESNYNDYKYIVEVTVTDSTGDTISGANSIIARLPNMYKKWNPDNRVQFQSESRFYKKDSTITLDGGLNVGKFTPEYENGDVMIIKKKEYYTQMVKDVRGYERPRTTSKEVLKEVLLINSENFDISPGGKLTLKYKLTQAGEYIFEYGRIHPGILGMQNGQTAQENVTEIVEKFQDTKTDNIYFADREFSVSSFYDTIDFIRDTCDGTQSECDWERIEDTLSCKKHLNKNISEEAQIGELCENKKTKFKMNQKISINQLIRSYDRSFFTIISYGEGNANNPVMSDNKITVLTEKLVYNIGDTAKILVRLPFSGGKILWTEEKNNVIASEYIDVPGNIFFKEIKVTDKHLPNTYIGVVAVDTNNTQIPQYKVGYTEIIGDKTDKKSKVSISSDKEVYEPRETVKLNLQTDKKEVTELTVMVVDDSLIALMGNVDVNILEKIYRKLPFQMQTSLTNIAMLVNYYFSRKGVVGGSGYGDFKGGDSAVSSRTIFKNTAYYNGSVVTNANGKATVEFELPDNLTNFRVMVVSQSKNNHYGYAEKMIEVRKDILLESRVPKMLRNGDSVELSANVFNASDTTIGFAVTLDADALEISQREHRVELEAGKSTVINWKALVRDDCDISNIEDDCVRNYTMTLLGDSAKHSDKLEKTFILASDPIILQNEVKTANINPGLSADFSLSATENTHRGKSNYLLSLGNNPFPGMEKLYGGLLRYPYGCVEQLLSSTLPNAILQRFVNLDEAGDINMDRLVQNLEKGQEKILKLQNQDGGFKYWMNDFTSDIEITPHVLRNLTELKTAGAQIDETVFTKILEYFSKNISGNTPRHIQLEALWATAQYMPSQEVEVLKTLNISELSSYDMSSMSEHELLSYTYALHYLDADKYDGIIRENIDTLFKKIKPIQKELYYSHTEDRATLAQLMIDTGFEQHEMTDIIIELYEKKWRSYWFSTKQKNAAFLAFAKYMEAYGTQYYNTAQLTFETREQLVSIDSKIGIYEIEKKLSEMLTGDSVSLEIKNAQGDATIFASSDIEIYPLDPAKIEPYSHKVNVQRVIYEVTDETQIKEICTWENGKRICPLPKGLKLHESDSFEKGKTYKIVLKSRFDADVKRSNLTLEDHLPAGFTVLNSKFLTNSIATSQETTGNTWRWNQTQIRPELVMANARYSWGRDHKYEYFVRADYAGEFLYPPLAGYLMYEPTVRANTGFRKIEIK